VRHAHIIIQAQLVTPTRQCAHKDHEMSLRQRRCKVIEFVNVKVSAVGSSVPVYYVLVSKSAANGRKHRFCVLPVAINCEWRVVDPRQLLTDEALHPVAGGCDCEQLALVGQRDDVRPAILVQCDDVGGREWHA
jgi:hypothetical protein